MKYSKALFGSLAFILLLLFICSLLQTPIQASDRTFKSMVSGTDSIEQKALDVLEHRCNTCHRKQNPFKIFKAKNLKKYAPLIKQQVFELKRMPKDGSTLSEAEQEALLDLIKSVKDTQ